MIKNKRELIEKLECIKESMGSQKSEFLLEVKECFNGLFDKKTDIYKKFKLFIMYKDKLETNLSLYYRCADTSMCLKSSAINQRNVKSATSVLNLKEE